MIDLVLIPALLGVAVGVAINTGIELYTDYRMEKERPEREAFFEALDRYHKHKCQGRGEKDLNHFRREVEKERGISHDIGHYNKHDELAKLGLFRGHSSRNDPAGSVISQKSKIQLPYDKLRITE